MVQLVLFSNLSVDEFRLRRVYIPHQHFRGNYLGIYTHRLVECAEECRQEHHRTRRREVERFEHNTSSNAVAFLERPTQAINVATSSESTL